MATPNHLLPKLGKGRTLAIIAEQPSDGQWTVRKAYVLTQSGNYGWEEDFCCNGKPIFRRIIDNAHQFAAVYDLRGETPDAATVAA